MFITGMTLWCVYCVAVTFVWLRRHRDVTRSSISTPPLHSGTFDAPPESTPRVSVVLAAKDEEPVIETCVRTLMAQNYPEFEVIVVNDRSQDRTGEILESLQGEYPDRLRVMHVRELLPGWHGKPNAMRIGVESASGDYFLFTDADCEQKSTNTISIAMRFVLEKKIDFLSILPIIEPSCVSESIIQPVCTAVLMLWHKPNRVNNPKRHSAYANGAFMLMRRDVYKKIGGHERVRAEFCEDMRMARYTKDAGLRLYVTQNRDLYSTKMYATFAQTWRGWSRIFHGALWTPQRVLASMLVLGLATVFPVITLLVAVVQVARHRGDVDTAWWILLACAGTAVAMLQSVMVRFYNTINAASWKSTLFAPAAVVCIGILGSAFRKAAGFGNTTWRGTTYHSTEAGRLAQSPIKEATADAG